MQEAGNKPFSIIYLYYYNVLEVRTRNISLTLMRCYMFLNV